METTAPIRTVLLLTALAALIAASPAFGPCLDGACCVEAALAGVCYGCDVGTCDDGGTDVAVVGPGQVSDAPAVSAVLTADLRLGVRRPAPPAHPIVTVSPSAFTVLRI